jgi:hypothetical protein
MPWGFVKNPELTSSYSRPLLLNIVLVATEYPKATEKRSGIQGHANPPNLCFERLTGGFISHDNAWYPNSYYLSGSKKTNVVLRTLLVPEL